MNTPTSSSERDLLERLCILGLKPDEAKVYLGLYRSPSTHLQLSRETGVNRTKVYRIVQELGKRGLIVRRIDDRGTFLVAGEITGLEVNLIQQEERLKRRRKILKNLASELSALKDKDASFLFQTYEGVTGYKQMCWHELRAKGDLLSFGNGTIEEELTDSSWSSHHRRRQIDAGYKTLEITNYDFGENGFEAFTARALIEAGLYEHRRLPPDVVTFDGQTVIYNDTVAIYHWKHEKKVGVELVSNTYADMMRQIFYRYWNMATEQPATKLP
jgi:DNA-binding MarR family transcriptional regulator